MRKERRDSPGRGQGGTWLCWTRTVRPGKPRRVRGLLACVDPSWALDVPSHPHTWTHTHMDAVQAPAGLQASGRSPTQRTCAPSARWRWPRPLPCGRVLDRRSPTTTGSPWEAPEGAPYDPSPSLAVAVNTGTECRGLPVTYAGSTRAWKSLREARRAPGWPREVARRGSEARASASYHAEASEDLRWGMWPCGVWNPAPRRRPAALLPGRPMAPRW